MKKFCIALILFFCVGSGIAFASSAAEWKIVPEQSKIEFKAMQNATTISGSFKKFDGKINFDPAQLSSSKLSIIIDMSSLQTSLAEATSTLQTAEWLAVKNFPKAEFVAEKFKKISDKKFVANGKLTIKGKSVPLDLEFALEEFLAKKARAIGTAKIKRSDFAIGAKDPANAHGVQELVEVNFVVNAMR